MGTRLWFGRLGWPRFGLGIEKSARYDATLVQSWTKTGRAMWSEVTLGKIFRCKRSDFDRIRGGVCSGPGFSEMIIFCR
jgi:hypothetical protein